MKKADYKRKVRDATKGATKKYRCRKCKRPMYGPAWPGLVGPFYCAKHAEEA